jgi:hypothetical protein
MVSPNYPLTSRVTVNRYWRCSSAPVLWPSTTRLQGDWPSHPTLDWLATEFVASLEHQSDGETDGDLATYRQSAVTPQILERDPYNRL